jgi:Ca-activated chloride channel family protein
MRRWNLLPILAVLLLSAAGWAQSTQELPAEPVPVQPRFPGAPQKTSAQPAPSQTTPALTTLPPSEKPAAQKPSPPAEPAAQPAAKAAPSSAPAPAASATQAEAAKEDTSEALYQFGVQVNLVNLIFTATDKHGHFIKDLKLDDLHLLDEGKPPERVVAFESQTGLPLRVGLLVDASSSIRDRFRFEQSAAVEFLQKVVRPNKDKAFVIGFDSLTDLTQDFTDNAAALAHGVDMLRAGGGTALHDAVFTASEKLDRAKVRGPARRAIILLSDGDDNQSQHTREEAIAAALRAEVIVYVISTDVTDSNRKGDKVLMRYAEATGGRVFYPLRIQDVADAFKQIQDELRSQYVLAYVPQDFVADGKYRSISMNCPQRKKIKIRVRRGYYAPRPQ